MLSGNRNFESRVHPLAKANYLMSPPLVVAYAIAGSVRHDLTREPLGTGNDGAPVFLRDIWPDDAEVRDVMAQAIDRDIYRKRYAGGLSGSDAWERLPYARRACGSPGIRPAPISSRRRWLRRPATQALRR